MNAFKLLEIMSKYNNCPICGNDKIGNGQGRLAVDENTFTRECKCGFKIMVDENDKQIQNKK